MPTILHSYAMGSVDPTFIPKRKIKFIGLRERSIINLRFSTKALAYYDEESFGMIGIRLYIEGRYVSDVDTFIEFFHMSCQEIEVLFDVVNPKDWEDIDTGLYPFDVYMADALQEVVFKALPAEIEVTLLFKNGQLFTTSSSYDDLYPLIGLPSEDD